MALRKWRFARRISALRHSLGVGVLSRPIARTPDEDIDRALDDFHQTRADLFTVVGAHAAHRVRIVRMLRVQAVDVGRAVKDHWEQLKIADTYCYYCPSSERCQRWLESPRHGKGPEYFCRNHALFTAISALQDRQRTETPTAR